MVKRTGSGEDTVGHSDVKPGRGSAGPGDGPKPMDTGKGTQKEQEFDSLSFLPSLLTSGNSLPWDSPLFINLCIYFISLLASGLCLTPPPHLCTPCVFHPLSGLFPLSMGLCPLPHLGLCPPPSFSTPLARLCVSFRVSRPRLRSPAGSQVFVFRHGEPQQRAAAPAAAARGAATSGRGQGGRGSIREPRQAHLPAVSGLRDRSHGIWRRGRSWDSGGRAALG